MFASFLIEAAGLTVMTSSLIVMVLITFLHSLDAQIQKGSRS
jgi:hypothetical protein